LREVIPDVRFADRIEVVTRDDRAAAAWTRSSPGFDNISAVNGGLFPQRNCATEKLLHTNGLTLVRFSKILRRRFSQNKGVALERAKRRSQMRP
jgi:hypothetical protein